MKKLRQKHTSKTDFDIAVEAPSKRGQPAKLETATTEALEQINLHAGGIDVGSAQNLVCVPAQAVKSGQSNVRSFGAFTKNLDDLVEWLKECGVTSAVMEATGIYWMSLYDKLDVTSQIPIAIHSRLRS